LRRPTPGLIPASGRRGLLGVAFETSSDRKRAAPLRQPFKLDGAWFASRPTHRPCTPRSLLTPTAQCTKQRHWRWPYERLTSLLRSQDHDGSMVARPLENSCGEVIVQQASEGSGRLPPEQRRCCSSPPVSTLINNHISGAHYHITTSWASCGHRVPGGIVSHGVWSVVPRWVFVALRRLRLQRESASVRHCFLWPGCTPLPELAVSASGSDRLPYPAVSLREAIQSVVIAPRVGHRKIGDDPARWARPANRGIRSAASPP
jgi:hypothetical protein